MESTAPSNRLAELRKSRELSRNALARELDPPVDPHTIYRWEHGRLGMKDQRKAQLAEHFGVSIAHLMGWDADEVPAWRR